MTQYIANNKGDDSYIFPDTIEEGDTILINNSSTGNTGNILHWTIPADYPDNAQYKITAMGARGGDSPYGLGAKITGENFVLNPGDELRILVGQQGINRAAGGGTFVTKIDGGGHLMYDDIAVEPLIVAGGGGAYDRAGIGEDDRDGRIVTSGGTDGNTERADDGYGGFSDSNSSGAGGGFFSGGSSEGSHDGKSFLSGGDGGTGDGTGGFGGGGSRNGGWGAGSAGGWSGGSANGGSESVCFGAGGGSYVNSSFGTMLLDSTETEAGFQDDHGQVILRYTGQLFTRNITGYVNVDGVGVENAAVYALNLHTESIDYIGETDSQGYYELLVLDDPYMVFARYESTENVYSSLCYPKVIGEPL